MQPKLAIGIDVGGSHVSCMAYNLIDKELIESIHVENLLNNHGQPDEVIEARGNTIKRCIELGHFGRSHFTSYHWKNERYV